MNDGCRQGMARPSLLMEYCGEEEVLGYCCGFGASRCVVSSANTGQLQAANMVLKTESVNVQV